MPDKKLEVFLWLAYKIEEFRAAVDGCGVEPGLERFEVERD